VTRTVKVLPLVHPAAIIRGGWGREMYQIKYLRRLRQWAFDGRPCEVFDPTQPPENANLFPTLDEIRAFLEDPRCQEQGVAIDLEAAGPHKYWCFTWTHRLFILRLSPDLDGRRRVQKLTSWAQKMG